jgi:serine/threonine protein kinase
MEHLDFYRQKTLPNLPSSRADSIEIPEHIGPYKIDSILHRGGMSILFLAHRPETKEVLAIKVLSPNLIQNQELVNKFLEEAQIIALTDHPNIIKLYGQGEWEKGLYIAMEFVQGISLKQFILGHSLSLRRSLDIILQVAYALLHLHTHGVIHRDLKPENILITENGHVKVIDFGIAHLEDSSNAEIEKLGGMIGTPSYMSPEQKINPFAIAPNSDIYSLGVIAYEILVGRLSFGNIQLELVPEYIRPILEKCLAPNPKERYQDIVDFITDLTAYLRKKDIEKDQSTEDQLKEAWENLGQQHKLLLPKTLPPWPEIEIALAKSSGTYLFGIYYDFFRLPDNSFVIIFAESPHKTLSSIASIATLRGIIRSIMHSYIYPKNKEPFLSARFAEKINQIFYDEPKDQNEALSILHLNPLVNKFSFISSGFDSLWHICNRGGAPRTVKNTSPLFGQEPNIEFYATNDSWNPGDVIILHSFNSPEIPGEQKKQIDILTLDTLRVKGIIAPKTLANSLLSTLREKVTNRSEKIVLTIARL